MRGHKCHEVVALADEGTRHSRVIYCKQIPVLMTGITDLNAYKKNSVTE